MNIDLVFSIASALLLMFKKKSKKVHPEPSDESDDRKYYTTKELSIVTRKIRDMCTKGRFERALRLCTRHLHASGHPVFHLERSAIYIHLKKYRFAKKDGDLALEKLPNSGDAYFAIAKALLMMKKTKKAKRAIEEGLKVDKKCVALRQLRRLANAEAIELTEEQIVELRESFFLFDDDLNGFIEPNELLDIMRDLGTEDITEKEVYRVLSHFDLNADNSIEFSEYVTMIANELKGMNMQKELRMAFNFFDTDRSGTVSIGELRNGLRKLGEHEIAHNVDIMSKDLKMDSELKFEDFVKAMLSNKYNS